MAIRPEIKYPGRTTPASDAYPLGSAQDITTPGDGTGTPLQKDWINDIWGFLQALLAATDITPSGTPDTAQNSQYLQALRALFSYFAFPSVTLAASESGIIAKMETYPYQIWTGRQWDVTISGSEGDTATALLTCTDATAQEGSGDYAITNFVHTDGIASLEMDELKPAQIRLTMSATAITQSLVLSLR